MGNKEVCCCGPAPVRTGGPSSRGGACRLGFQVDVIAVGLGRGGGLRGREAAWQDGAGGGVGWQGGRVLEIAVG